MSKCLLAWKNTKIKRGLIKDVHFGVMLVTKVFVGSKKEFHFHAIHFYMK